MSNSTSQGSLEYLNVQTMRILEAMNFRHNHNTALYSDGTQLIGIVGDRGSGKTTLLHSVCEAAARQHNWIVLPVVRPELMPASESTLVAMIGQMARLTVTQPDLFSSGEGIAEIEQLSHNVLRAALYLGRETVQDVLTNSPSLGQFAADSASVLFRASTLTDDLQSLVVSLLRETGRQGIIIGVDDIDLIPGRLSQLLSDVRLLSSCPGILPVICLSWNDLRGSLRAEMMSLYPSLDPASLEKSVAQQVMKTMRPDRIFEPLQLPRNQRLDYRPIESDASLGEVLLKLFSLIQGKNREPLGQWLAQQLGSDERRVLGFAWLPDTYRGLEHLYYSASSLIGALSGDRSALELGQQLRQMVGSVSRETSGFDVNLEIQAGGSGGQANGLVAVAEWPNYSLRISANRESKRIFQSRGTRILLREVARPLATERLSVDSRQSETRGHRDLTMREMSGALLVQSLLSSSIFEDPPPSGPLSLVDDSCVFLQEVRIVGLPTDDGFFYIPPSSGIVYVDRWTKTWNWIVNQTAKSDEGSAPADRLLTNICVATVQIWSQGRAPELVEPARSLRTAFAEASRLYVTFAATLIAEDDWQWLPAAAYCQWYEKLLPNSFHDALLTADTLQAVLETWQAAISSGSRADAGVVGLRDVYSRRMGVQSSELKSSSRSRAWLYGYRALLGNVAPDLAILLKEFEKEYVERGGRGSKGRDAVEENVLILEGSSRYSYATRKTVEAIEEEQLLRRVLAQLKP